MFDDENFWQAYIDRYFTLRDGVSGYIAQIEATTDLQIWGGAAGFTLADTASNGKGTRTLTYRGPLTDRPLYLRIRATRIP